MLLKSLRYLVLAILTALVVAGCGQAQPGGVTSGQTGAATSKEGTQATGAKPEAAPAKTSNAATFFQGKTVTFIVGSAAGGSYDTVGRMLAEYIGKHTGARVVVKNVEGGGGIQGANAIYTSKPDGLTIGLVSIGMIQAQALGGKGVQFDLNKMGWLGQALTSGSCAVVSAKSQYKSVEDLLATKSFTEGNAGAGSLGYLLSVLRAEATGWNAKMVTGYANTNEAILAMVRGEIDVVSTSWDTVEPFAKSGDALPVYTDNRDGVPGHPEIRTLSEIPAVVEKLTAQGKELLDLDAAIAGGRRMVAGPPGMPADIRAYLEEILQKKVLTDPDFIHLAHEEQNYTISPISGSKLAEEMEHLMGIVDKNRAVIEEGIKKGQR